MRTFAQKTDKAEPSASTNLKRPGKSAVQPTRDVPGLRPQAAEEIQAKRVRDDDSAEIAAPPVVHEVLRSPGQPLDPTTRGFMEPRFGHDFSHVRVHTNTRAGEAASAINARAFTMRRDIVFGSGEYAPQTESGRYLLSHELAHVLQQGAGVQLKGGLGQRGDAEEKAADEVAQKVMDGQPVSINEDSANVINRKEKGDAAPGLEPDPTQAEATGGDINPYEERRYQGAVYKLSEKFGSDFVVLFNTGHLGGFGKTINPDSKGQVDLTNKIREFDFTSLQNRSDDPYPSTLDLQSIMSWRVDSKARYAKKSWRKTDLASEPTDRKTMVDNPGFRDGGIASVDLVSDLAVTAGANIRFIVRLMIVEDKPIA